MPIEVSGPTRQAAEARNSSEVFIELVTFMYPDLREPLRLANNTQDITSRGDLFIGFPFDDLSPPTDVDGPPEGRLSIQNIDREIGKAIKLMTTPPRVLLEQVMASSPDDVFLKFDYFYMQDISADALTVSGSLRSFNWSQEPWPRTRASQALTPNLYR